MWYRDVIANMPLLTKPFITSLSKVMKIALLESNGLGEVVHKIYIEIQILVQIQAKTYKIHLFQNRNM